jgi:hypothetical protein
MAPILLDGPRETVLPSATIEGDRLWIPLDELERATGWSAKPEGLCRDEVCVPVPEGRRAEWLDGDGRRLDFAAFARHLGHALARDDGRGVWALGPATRRGLGVGSGPVAAPDFRLPDLDGQLGALSDHRGKKVLLYCWASW